jgi:thymidine kinase
MINNNQGSLDLIIGNMFSGKSTELIRRINTIKSINKKVLIINYIHDNRNSHDSVSTHDSVKVKSLKSDLLLLIDKEIIMNSDFIFIDEGQFFTDLLDFVKLYVDFYNKKVVVSGLDGDSNRKKFGNILDLIPLSDSVLKLTAYCIKCCDGTYGPFTKKILNNDILIDIGGSDKYIPVCRRHYFNE